MPDYEALRRSPYYVKPRKEAPKKTPGTQKQRCEPKVSTEIFDLISNLAVAHGYATQRPEQPLVRFGPHVLINGKRCRVGHIKTEYEPRPGGPRYVRGSVNKESLSITDYHVFVVEVSEGARDVYILPSNAVREFLFARPIRATRKESTAVRALHFPYPPHPGSHLEHYRNAWALLA